MKSLSLFAAALAVAIVGCNEAKQAANVATHDNQATGVVANDNSARDNTAVNSARDNTAVNERDRTPTAKTPFDQNENKADIDITANIRKKVVDTKMSVDAQNVKIITQNGQVTLRGPVKSADEKKQIEDIAHQVAGTDKVSSQLEVANNP